MTITAICIDAVENAESSINRVDLFLSTAKVESHNRDSVQKVDSPPILQPPIS